MNKDTFNKDFFVTAATLIPVLYLALTLQGKAFGWISTRYKSWIQTGRGDKSVWQYLISGGIFDHPIQRLLVSLLVLVSISIVGAGAVGEIYAIQAIYKGSATPQSALTVLICFYILLGSVLIGPASSAARMWLGQMTWGLFERVKEGSNAKRGTVTLSSGKATVPDKSVTAKSRIFLTAQDDNTTGTLRVSDMSAGASFSITSSVESDSGVVAYEIFEQT